MDEASQTTTDEPGAVTEPQTVQGSAEPAVVETETVNQPVEPTAAPLLEVAQEAPAMPETVSGPEPVQSIETVEPAPTSPTPVPETVKEVVIEKPRDLNENEKEQIFRDKLKVLSPRGVSARRQKKQANLDKILTHLRQHGYITNDEVEELCKVKDRTAFQYLEELQQQGKLMQLGKTGRQVRYRLTEAIP